MHYGLGITFPAFAFPELHVLFRSAIGSRIFILESIPVKKEVERSVIRIDRLPCTTVSEFRIAIDVKIQNQPMQEKQAPCNVSHAI